MFHVVFAVIMLIIGGPLLLGAYFSEPASSSAGCVVILLLIAGLFLFWMGKYHQTIIFEIKDEEAAWKKGVCFRMTGIVSYDRITNINIYQGPLMHNFGFSSNKLQTSGYSAQARHEIPLEGIATTENFMEIIRSLIRDSKEYIGAFEH